MSRHVKSLPRLGVSALRCPVMAIAGVACALGFTHSAQATPTTAPFWGQTGLGVIPTTQTVPEYNVELAVGYEHINPEVGRTRFLPVTSAVYGLRRAEVGVGFLREDTRAFGSDFDGNYFSAFGKYRLYEAKNGAQIAVGGNYLNFDDSAGNVVSLYLNGSYPFGARKDGSKMFRVHGGILLSRTHVSGDSTTGGRPFVGLEYLATPQISLAADYVPSQGDNVSLKSLALRYQNPEGLGAQIGVGEFRSSDTKVFAGLSYRFDLNKGAKP